MSLSRSAWGLLLLVVLNVCGPGLHAEDVIQVDNSNGWQIYPGGGYRYGPSIIINDDGSINMWLAAPGAQGAWDYIKYRQSTDGGHTWTPDVDALKPTPGSRDALSTCDPGVIKFDGYYFVGYTSTEDKRGTNNQIYLARSKSPAGPYEKWNGNGWGGSPHPILSYAGDSSAPGYMEPSFVLQSGTLYLYFSGGEYTDLAICTDPTPDDWPAHLALAGHVIKRRGDDSIDVKFVDEIDRFVAVATHNRFSPNSTVHVWESFDGHVWRQTLFRGTPIQSGAHNIGISGTETGHLDTRESNFIAYAYQPSGFSWGNWPTHLDPVTLTTTGPGGFVNIEVSSIPQGSNWNWNGPRLSDGDVESCWSSESHGRVSRATEWAYADMGTVQNLAGVRITPRRGGVCFPLDFKLQWSVDSSVWTDVPGQSYEHYTNPGSSSVTFSFGSPVAAKYIRLFATRLSADEYGDHYLQIAEMEPVISSPNAPG